MLKNPNIKEFEKDCYTINNFRGELNALIENRNNLSGENKKFSKMKNMNIKNNKMNPSNMRKNANFDINDEDIIKNEITNMKSENDELRFCLNSIIKLLSKKIFKISNNYNMNDAKTKNKEISNHYILIQNLKDELINLEKILSGSNKRNKTSAICSNKKEKQNEEKDIKIDKYKIDLERKNEELLKEIENLKAKLSNQEQAINILNKDLIKKNQIINQLKNNNNNFTGNNNILENKFDGNKTLKKENEKSKKELNYDNNEKERNLKDLNNDNKLKEENNNLKKINKDLNSKYKEMANLKIKYDELLININELKKENSILKNKLNQPNNTSRNTYNSKKSKVNFNYYNELPNNNMLINNTTISDNNDYKTIPILYDNIYKKNFAFDKMRKTHKLTNSEQRHNNISLNDDKINKKATLSSLIISDTTRGKKRDNKRDNNSNYSEIEQSFNLYKPLKEGLLVFNIFKKIYYISVPDKYYEFWEQFESEGSLQYNTLEGLFLINPKDNQLYYYSSKKNIICDLLTFKENHSYGCLFVDNLSKNIIAIGGKFSKLVELFSFESEKIEDLPELSTYRSKMTCCQINNKIYCLFGLNEESKDDSKIEYLDLDDLNNGWVEINYINNTSFTLLTCMSCVNLDNAEMLIIGGMKNDNTPNEKLIYYNIESKELYELDKDLPESDNKKYLFTNNNMFNLFLNGNKISFINIDDNRQIHIIDNELKYDLYLAPNI